MMKDNILMTLKSFGVMFDPTTGMAGGRAPIRRRLSQMKGIFTDKKAFREKIAHDDALVYEFYDLGIPCAAGEIAFGTSILYPGRVGAEYFLTKGHFHEVLETAEVYYCLRGQGLMLMENPEGDWEAREMSPGAAVYVPPRFAHRSINVSDTEPLVSFFAFRGDAGHDYRTIETGGFRKIVVTKNGRPEIVDNPGWKSAPN